MINLRGLTSAISMAALVVSCLVAFQNCGNIENGQSSGSTSPVRSNEVGRDVATEPTPTATPEPTASPVPAKASCTFNDQTVAHGESVVAYLNSVDPVECEAEPRQCDDGALSGSYTFAKCEKRGLKSCTFNGKQLSSGESVIAYLSAKSEPGKACQAEFRVCTDGMLSGTHTAAKCVTQGPGACEFNGKTVESGKSVTAFLQASVPHGSSCTKETRVCKDGKLSGSNRFAACVVDKPAPCLFDGRTLAHGEKVPAFRESTVPFGGNCQSVSETIACENGKMSKPGLFATCAVGKPKSCLHAGRTVPHGKSLTAYKVQSVEYGKSCADQDAKLTCNDGTFGPSAKTYPYASCVVKAAASCTFNGQTIEDRQFVTGYSKATVPAGESCATKSGTLQCLNGKFSPSVNDYPFSKCEIAVGPKDCRFGSATVANGQSVKGYKTSLAKWPATCESKSFKCVDGLMQGVTAAYPYTSCTGPRIVTEKALELGKVGFSGGYARVTLMLRLPGIPNAAPLRIKTTVSGTKSYSIEAKYRDFKLPFDGNPHPVVVDLRPDAAGAYAATIHVIYDDSRAGYKVWQQPVKLTGVAGNQKVEIGLAVPE